MNVSFNLSGWLFSWLSEMLLHYAHLCLWHLIFLPLLCLVLLLFTTNLESFLWQCSSLDLNCWHVSNTHNLESPRVHVDEHYAAQNVVGTKVSCLSAFYSTHKEKRFFFFLASSLDVLIMTSGLHGFAGTVAHHSRSMWQNRAVHLMAKTWTWEKQETSVL